jgi:hypothetical protein
VGWSDVKAGSGFFYVMKEDQSHHTLVLLGEAEQVVSRFGNKRVLVNAVDEDALEGEKAGILALNVTTGEKLRKALEADDPKKSKVGTHWITIQRHGTGMRDTQYEIAVGKKLTPKQIKKAKSLALNDLLHLDEKK